MKKNEFISNRLREVFLNGQWVANTNFKEQISDLSWEQATQKVYNLNTIAALTYHVYYYLSGVLRVLEGENLDINDKYSFDIPILESEADWRKLMNDFLNCAERFADKVEQMPEEKFDNIFVDKKYGNYQRNLEGMIEHGYYHLGQISLVKKIILENEKISS